MDMGVVAGCAAEALSGAVIEGRSSSTDAAAAGAAALTVVRRLLGA